MTANERITRYVLQWEPIKGRASEKERDVEINNGLDAVYVVVSFHCWLEAILSFFGFWEICESRL